MTTAGVGNVAGPAFAGALVDRYGLAAPFTVAAAVTAVLVAALALETSGTGHREATEGIPAGVLSSRPCATAWWWPASC